LTAGLLTSGVAITVDQDHAAASVSVAPDGSAELVLIDSGKDSCDNAPECKESCKKMEDVCEQYEELSSHQECGFIAWLCCSDMPPACLHFWGGEAQAAAAGLCTTSGSCATPTCAAEEFFIDNFLTKTKQSKGCVDLQCSQPSLAEALSQRRASGAHGGELGDSLADKNSQTDLENTLNNDDPLAGMMPTLGPVGSVVAPDGVMAKDDVTAKDDATATDEATAKDEAEGDDDEDSEEKEDHKKKEKKGKGKNPNGDVPETPLGQALLRCFHAVN